MTLHNSVCTGSVIHRRHHPVIHSFRYPVWMLLADIEDLDELPLRWMPVSLRTEDVSVDGENARAGIVERVVSAGLPAPNGRIFVLLQPRSWGVFFNPVVFYVCIHEGRVSSIVAVVNNTPWNERHSYVLDARNADTDDGVTIGFPKAFHVSPFASMDIDYVWRFEIRDEQISIGMRLLEDGVETMYAGLFLELAEITPARVRAGALRYPFQNVLTLGRIYWNALRLWLKQATFYPHPEKTA